LLCSSAYYTGLLVELAPTGREDADMQYRTKYFSVPWLSLLHNAELRDPKICTNANGVATTYLPSPPPFFTASSCNPQVSTPCPKSAHPLPSPLPSPTHHSRPAPCPAQSPARPQIPVSDRYSSTWPSWLPAISAGLPPLREPGGVL
jgi:hypothetical protein